MSKHDDLPPADNARPTMALRWLQQWSEDGYAPEDVMQMQFGKQYPKVWRSRDVLQQAWVSPGGVVTWRDIPREETPCPQT